MAHTSAIFVEIMILRLPLSAGSNTRSCSSVESPACRAKGVSFVAVLGSL